jgi:hypothetical protein
MTVFDAVSDALHRANLWDVVIPIYVIESTMIGHGPQVYLPEGKMNYSGRWKMVATNENA